MRPTWISRRSRKSGVGSARAYASVAGFPAWAAGLGPPGCIGVPGPPGANGPPRGEARGDPAATTADQWSDRAMVIREEPAGRLVALTRREGGEALEIGERDREWFAGAFAGIVLRSGRQHLDGGEAQRREQ